MQSGQIITIVAYDQENQAFQFTGKVSDSRGDSIILDVVYDNALEHQNSPFQLVDQVEESVDLLTLLLTKQFLKYRNQGFDIEKCLKWITEDRDFIYEEF